MRRSTNTTLGHLYKLYKQHSIVALLSPHSSQNVLLTSGTVCPLTDFLARVSVCLVRFMLLPVRLSVCQTGVS